MIIIHVQAVFQLVVLKLSASSFEFLKFVANNPWRCHKPMATEDYAVGVISWN